MTDISLSFTPNELVATGSTLTISGVPEVDAQTAQGAVHVFGIDGPVPVLVHADPAAGTGPADATTVTADASTTASSPLGVLSLVIVFIGAALVGARLVARRSARAP